MCQAPWDRSTEPDRVWTTEQLGTFLISARSHRLYAFYRLAAYTGARRGELPDVILRGQSAAHGLSCPSGHAMVILAITALVAPYFKGW